MIPIGSSADTSRSFLQVRTAEDDFQEARSILGGVANHERAIPLLERSMHAGHVPAGCLLCACYLKGIGCEKNVATASAYLQRIFDMKDGHDIAKLIPELWQMKEMNPDDLEPIIPVLESVLEKVVDQKKIEALALLSFVHMSIASARNDQDKSHYGFEYLKQAADLGYADAQYLYAVILSMNNTQSAFREMEPYLKKAAAAGQVDAMMLLVGYYEQLDNPQPFAEISLGLLKKAAMSGNLHALRIVAERNLEGKAGIMDVRADVQALRLIAASRGCDAEDHFPQLQNFSTRPMVKERRGRCDIM